MELLLIAGATAVLGTASYELYVVTERHQKLNLEQEHLSALTTNTLTGYASSETFDALSQTTALEDHLFPPSMVDAAGTPRNAWGGEVEITGVTLPDGNGASADVPGFAITYDAVPAYACQPLVANAGPGFYAVMVQGTSVLNAQKQVQMNQVASLCDQPDGAVVQFIYAKDGNTGVTNNPDLGNCTIPPPQTQKVNCPDGQIDANPPYSAQGVTQQREGSCPDPYGAVNWTAWHTTANTCAPICTPPAPTATSRPTTGTCPAGQYVSGTTNPTFPQTQAGSISYICPAPTGSYTTNPTSWGAITPPASAVCAPACTSPAPQTRNVACPPGQAVPGPFPANYNGVLQQRTGACTSPTGSGYYNPWQTLSTSCAPVCSAPPPQRETMSQNQDLGCTGGWVGQRIFSVEYAHTRTASCATVTGPATWSPWSPWVATGNETKVSNTCQDPNPPPAPAPPPPPPPPAPAPPPAAPVITAWTICTAPGSSSGNQSCQSNVGSVFASGWRNGTGGYCSVSFTLSYAGQSMSGSLPRALVYGGGSTTMKTTVNIGGSTFTVSSAFSVGGTGGDSGPASGTCYAPKIN